MVWWKKTAVSICGIALALVLSLSGLFLALESFTKESALRQFVSDVAQMAGTSQADADTQFNKFYFATYPCGGVPGCISNPPSSGISSVLLSKTGHDFFAKSFSYSIIIGLAAILILLFAAETWSGRLRAIGIPAVVAGLNVFTPLFARRIVLGAVSAQQSGQASMLLNQFFGSFTTFYFIVLGAGILLTLAGFFLWRRERNASAEQEESA